MRIGMRLLLGYFLIVAIAAWFVLSIFVQEVKPGVRRATEGTLNDTATLLAALAREDLLAANPQQGRLAQAFHQLNQQPLNANIGGIKKVRNEYRVYLTDARGKVVARGITYVSARIPGLGNAPFVAKVPGVATATSFRASVSSFRAGLGTQAP